LLYRLYRTHKNGCKVGPHERKILRVVREIKNNFYDPQEMGLYLRMKLGD
jgi:spore cortex formation protein SpoVR/YcgB (stage V sporulation)